MKYVPNIRYDLSACNYMYYSMAHHLRSGIEAIFAPDCSLILETAQ